MPSGIDWSCVALGISLISSFYQCFQSTSETLTSSWAEAMFACGRVTRKTPTYILPRLRRRWYRQYQPRTFFFRSPYLISPWLVSLGTNTGCEFVPTPSEFVDRRIQYRREGLLCVPKKRKTWAIYVRPYQSQFLFLLTVSTVNPFDLRGRDLMHAQIVYADTSNHLHYKNKHAIRVIVTLT